MDLRIRESASHRQHYGQPLPGVVQEKLAVANLA
jgi:hypothetical protein